MLYVLLAGVLLAAASQPARGGTTLDEAIREALANNAGLLAERSNIAIADAQILTAGMRPNPTATFGGDHLDLLGTRFNEVNGGGPGEIASGIEFTHETGGKRERRIEVARAARSAAGFDYLNSARSLILDVRNAFTDALLARDTLEVARENLGFFSQIVGANEERVRAGDVAEVELIRSRIAALQYQAEVRQSELKYRTALVRLQTLMGRKRTDAAFEITGALDRPEMPAALEQLQRSALESRPDLNALRHDAQRAGAGLRLEMAQAKPDVTFGTEYRRQQFNASANALTITLGIPLPVFDRNQGGIARAREEQRQAELRVRALETSIAGEVEEAYAQLRTARSLLDAVSAAMVEQARQVRDITEYSYKRGEASMLALLDAQRAFNDTIAAHIEARAQYARSLDQLDFVTGKGAIQ
jgi:cobalt-zinc-cadmium efflux system outer membrane protein